MIQAVCRISKDAACGHGRATSWVLGCAAIVILAFSGCALIDKSHDSAKYGSFDGTSPGVLGRGKPFIEPWFYAGNVGQSIRTTHYRIHTTSRNDSLNRVLPMLYESANLVYRRMLGSPSNDRPLVPSYARNKSEERMDVYLFGTRGEWEQFSTDLLVLRAKQYFRIKRGGFSTRGSSIIYDLGVPDTIRIAAHEGWHQFVQANFAEPLPVWLDEGMATRMEAMVPVENARAFEIHPWVNIARLRRIRELWRTNRLRPIAELIVANPDTLLYESDDAVLDYYAQVWGFALFLEEYDHGRYADRLQLLLRDARDHRLSGRIRASIDGEMNADHRVSKEDITQDSVLRIYFNRNLEAMQNEWIDFIEIVCAEGAEQVAARGRSPYRYSWSDLH